MKVSGMPGMNSTTAISSDPKWPLKFAIAYDDILLLCTIILLHTYYYVQY